jgi:soluble lytic murein transglycosylase
MQRRKQKLCFLVKASALLCASALTANAGSLSIEQQRQLFEQTYPAAELGDWRAFTDLAAPQQQALQNYVLWPDLRAAYLRAAISRTPAREVQDFLAQYGTLRPARELRYRYALQLARSGSFDAYHEVYQQFYQGRDIAKLDCLALQADLDAGRHERVASLAIKLWLIGRSQVDECDPVFDYLKQQHKIGPAEHRERYGLAVESREFGLARWLARSIDQQHADEALLWQKAQRNPADFLSDHALHGDTGTALEQLQYALERLTYRDPELAQQAWLKVAATHAFNAEKSANIARHIALWMARDNLPGAYELLAALPNEAQDQEVRRWRARTSLRRTDWPRLLDDIDAMGDELRLSEEWRYWHAVALQRSGKPGAAEEAFRDLSGERSYYGFLAADELGTLYALDHSDLVADENTLNAIATNPAIVRARELFYVGLEGRGRSEWDDATRGMPAEEKRQAAILASRWGWHSRAIATAASLGEYDDLSIRYPLPYKSLFEESSTQASISPTWAYGIARSESLFMRDIRSSAGAVGLMQLMPSTGRQLARSLRLPYSGLKTLTNPESNIRLGTRYLGEMAERYGGNPVLATAAYNAGPHRVDRWLPENGTLDARVWIETIPFNETRNYVKRVLAAQAIFHWRITGELRRLSDELLQVRASPERLKLASR